MSFVYVDSSAIVKLIRRESETDALRAFLAGTAQDHPVAVASSAIARVEVSRATLRHDPAVTAKASEVLATFRLISVTEQVLAQASHLPPMELRSPDAIHLATAISESNGMVAFLTYDNPQAEAARAAGLPVLSPGRRDN
jgi:predicted nucleic acid-binding protein